MSEDWPRGAVRTADEIKVGVEYYYHCRCFESCKQMGIVPMVMSGPAFQTNDGVTLDTKSKYPYTPVLYRDGSYLKGALFANYWDAYAFKLKCEANNE